MPRAIKPRNRTRVGTSLPLSPADHAHASSAAQLWRDAHEQPKQAVEQQVGELLRAG